MNQNQFDELLNELLDKEDQILRSKGKEYAQDTDRLQNFRERAHFEGRTLSEVALGDMMKHIQSIKKAVQDGQIEEWRYTNKNGGEGLKQRFVDARNYLALLMACIEEEHHQHGATQKPEGSRFLFWNGREGRVVRSEGGGLCMEMDKTEALLPYDESYVQVWL